jgi:hypothetical protein
LILLTSRPNTYSTTAQDIDLLKEQVKNFLSKRESIFKGDTHDYNSNTPGNNFCIDVVKILFPNENPENILLTNALTKDRDASWFDPLELKSELPNSRYFFRNKLNQIHLYPIILERAIIQLKAGYSNLNEIWLGTDPKKNKNTPALNPSNEYDTPLSDGDLKLIAQRTPTFGVLVDYTKKLQNKITTQPKNAFEYFHALRIGLLKGDASHGGAEYQAGSDAYIAIAEFVKWWHPLDKDKQKKFVSLQLKVGLECHLC